MKVRRGTRREAGLGQAQERRVSVSHGMPRAQEAQERRVSVSHSVSLSAWAPRSRSTFLQDSPQARPCGLGHDIHVAHGPEVRYRTPSASWVTKVLWFLIDKHGKRLRLGTSTKKAQTLIEVGQ